MAPARFEQLPDRAYLASRDRSGRPRSVGHQLSEAADFWLAYRGWRLRTLIPPLNQIERTISDRVALRLQDYLGLDPPGAAQQARRNVFYRRERLFHETLALDLSPDRLHELLDAMAVEGVDQLRELPAAQGILLLSLHYSVFSSLLLLWLTRAAAQGLFKHLTILIDPGPGGTHGLPSIRADVLEAGGLGRRSATSLLDMKNVPSATRQLTAELRDGGAALVLPDATFLPSTADRALSLRVGDRQALLPRGAAWLAQVARCSVVPVHTRPLGDSYALVFGPPVSTEDDPASAVEVALQRLFAQTALADPGPWEGWPSLPLVKEGPVTRRQGEASPSAIFTVEGGERM